MKIITSYVDYINESVGNNNTQPKNDIINESVLKYTPTKRRAGDVESELEDLVYAKNNVRKIENEVRDEMMKKYHDTVLPIWERYLPNGLTVLHKGKKLYYEHYYNPHHEIYEKSTGNALFSITLDIASENVTLNSLTKSAYIDYYKTSAVIDTPEIDRLIYLGKMAERFGNSNSSFYKEWFDAVISLKEEEEAKMAEAGDIYSIGRKLKDKYIEFLNAEFEDALYRNAVYNYIGNYDELPTVDVSRFNRRGNKVKSVRIDSLKRANADVTYTVIDRNGNKEEKEGTWRIDKLFRFWVYNTREGNEITKEWGDKTSIHNY